MTESEALAAIQAELFSGNSSEAERLCQSAAQQFDSSQFYAWLGAICEQTGRYEEAIGHCDKAIAKDSSAWMARRVRSLARKARSNPEDAKPKTASIRTDQRAALYRQLEVVMATDGVAAMYAVYADGPAEVRETIPADQLEEIVQRVSGAAAVIDLAAIRARLNSGDPIGAEELTRQSLTRFADLGELHGLLAYCMQQQGKLEEAVAASASATDISPGDWLALFTRGMALRSLGRVTEARAVFARTAQVYPSDVSMRTNLLETTLESRGFGAARLVMDAAPTEFSSPALQLSWQTYLVEHGEPDVAPAGSTTVAARIESARTWATQSPRRQPGMKMKPGRAGQVILGLQAGHDASATIIRDGKILSHILRERVTRRRHDYGIDKSLVQLSIAAAGIEAGDIDLVALTATQNMHLVMNDKQYIQWRPLNSDGDKLCKSIAQEFPHHISSPWWQDQKGSLLLTRATPEGTVPDLPFVHRDIECFFTSCEIQRRIPRTSFNDWQIDTYLSPIYGPARWSQPIALDDLSEAVREGAEASDLRFGMHHPIEVELAGRVIPGVFVAHHAAHAASSYYSSLGGEALVFTHDGGMGLESGFVFRASANRINPVSPHYLECGQFYDAAAVRCGFDAIGGAGKLMGLSAYGSSDLSEDWAIGSSADWAGWYGKKLPDAEPATTHRAIIDEWIARAAERGLPTEEIGKTILGRANVELAHTAQRVVEQTMFKAVMAARNGLIEASFRPSMLCLSGGVALNCPSNTKLFMEGGFDYVHVEPHCDDGGLSIGAAWWLHYNLLDQPFEPATEIASRSAMLGVDHGDVDSVLAKYGNRICARSVDDPALEIAALLADDNVVAVFEGRSETGPRALGHRSILANPQILENWARVNRIKAREAWRPFAPVVQTGRFEEYFENGPNPSPFMLFTHQVREEMRSRLPAITHADGTARVQTVDREDGLMWHVLERLGERTGIPVVMNTSFNGPGEPVVETHEDAIQFLLSSTELSAVYFPGYIVTRPKLSTPEVSAL